MVDEVSPSYWRVTFENGPVNLLDPDSVKQLAELVSQIEESQTVTVVVFDSANPEYFMAHWDFRADRARVAAMTPGPTGLHPYVDNLIRLSKVPTVTTSSIRGKARGAGSEFVLATDIRFAGDKATLGQFEVGVGSVPGGGPMARLGRLVGRGRAAEILFGGDDFPAELAERYGYVNRVLPDAGLAGFVDAFARRIAGFDKEAIAGYQGTPRRRLTPTRRRVRPGPGGILPHVGPARERPPGQASLRIRFADPDGSRAEPRPRGRQFGRRR
jgi:enoyl-CoA hydratase/carnithine racemase